MTKWRPNDDKDKWQMFNWNCTNGWRMKYFGAGDFHWVQVKVQGEKTVKFGDCKCKSFGHQLRQLELMGQWTVKNKMDEKNNNNTGKKKQLQKVGS